MSAQESLGVKPGISINGSPCLIQNLIYSCTPRTCDSIVIMAGDSIEFCTYQQIFLNTDTAYWLKWNFYGATSLADTILNDYPSSTPQCYFPRWDTAGTFMVEVFYNGVLSAYPTSDCYQQGPSHWFVKVVVLPDPNAIVEHASKEFKIVPNPSQGFFTIQLPENEILNQVVITDVSGRIIFQTHDTSIDLTSLEHGTYLATISTANSVFSQAFIIH
jgi:hypothetical protein